MPDARLFDPEQRLKAGLVACDKRIVEIREPTRGLSIRMHRDSFTFAKTQYMIYAKLKVGERLVASRSHF
jgi:hypothetical protein